MADKDEKQRIVDLEAEVASLRAKLGEHGEHGEQAEGDVERGEVEESPLAGAPGEDLTPRPPMAKVVILSAIVVIVGLAMIFGVFTVLSKGFDKFAPKAAERFVPKPGDRALPPPTTKVVPGTSPPKALPADAGVPKERILVPGL